MNVLRKFLGEDDSDNWFVVCHNESKVKENMSYFGNQFVTITEKDIEMLKAGMTLSYMVNDEYGFFINFSKGDDVKQKRKEEFRYAF